MKTGDTLLWSLTFTQGTTPDVPLDLTGYAITLTIKSSGGTTLAILTIGNGITVTSPATQGLGVATVADTSAWTGTLLAQFKTTDASGTKLTYDPVVIGMQSPI